jgi:hypothetical protein
VDVYGWIGILKFEKENIRSQIAGEVENGARDFG